MSHWHPVAHASELANEGDFILLPWRANGEIAVMRQAGDLVAFDNLCPHRGARIFTEIRGNREPRCVYHARLATADNVRRFQLMTLGDWIFAGTWQTPPSPFGRIDDLMGQVPPLRLHSTLAFTMDCHWTVAIENALDSEHIEHVHPNSLSKMALTSVEQNFYRDGSSFERFRSDSGRLGRMGKFFPGEQRFDYAHAHLFPYSCLSSTRGWTYSLQHYFPRADGRTNFIHRLYAAQTTRPLPEFFDSVARLNEAVFREDAEICARVPAHFAGTLGPREERIAKFRSALVPAHSRDFEALLLHHLGDSEGGEL
jgi:phenylpropionate dioxygenase-like ring-hydroxylating dioxygenase large terminal subunit